MKYTLLFLLLTCSLISSNAAYGQAQRTLGGSRLDLDDNAGNHVFLANSFGSLGINDSSFAPSVCALLDLSSTTKGFLIPRMTSLQELALCGGTPPEGLMVYNTTTHSVDVYNGTTWGSSSGWGLFGNSGTNSIINFLGTTDFQDLIIKTNSTERMRVSAFGPVSIGIPSGFGLLNVGRTAITNGSVLADLEMTVSPSGAASSQFDGAFANLQVQTPNPITGSVISSFFVVQSANGSTGAINEMIGVLGDVGNYSAATITRADAVYGQIQSQNAGGLMIDGSNFHAQSFIVTSQSVTNLRGLYINNPLVIGTVTNNYGIDIDQLSSGTNNTAFRYNHSTQPVIISGAGDVRIGGTPSIFTPPGLITTRIATTPVGGAKLSTESQLIVNPSVAGGTQYIATYSHVDASNSLSLGSSSLYGLWGGAELTNATAAIGSARGVFGELFYQTTQPLNDGAGLAGIVDMESAGSIGTASGIRVSFVKPNGGTITDLKLMNVLDLFSNVGTIANTYGLYIGNLTLGTQTNQAYSLFASDAGSRSFIAGNTGIGTTFTSVANDPATAVDIAGALSVRYNNSTYILSAIPAFNNSAFLNMGSGSSQQGFVTFVPQAPGSNISGLGPGTNGRILIIHKSVGGNLVFINEDAVNEPTADNRIHCVSGANVTIPAGEAIITLIHEGNPGGGINRWLILSVNTAF